MQTSHQQPDGQAPLAPPYRRPLFVTLYVIVALFVGSTLCYVYGRAFTVLWDDYSPDSSTNRLLDIRTELWTMGAPFLVAGLLTLIGVWLMRTWGLVLAILVHIVGILALIVWIIELTDAPGVVVLLVFGILAQLGIIARFLQHRTLFGRPKKP